MDDVRIKKVWNTGHLDPILVQNGFFPFRHTCGGSSGLLRPYTTHAHGHLPQTYFGLFIPSPPL